MKLSKLIEVFQAMQALSQTKLPAKVGYRVAKSINMIRPELEAYEQQRAKLAESLGKISDDGKQYLFDGQSGKDFQDQISAMLDEEVTLDLPSITPEDLGDAEIEPMHLAALDDFFIKQAT